MQPTFQDRHIAVAGPFQFFLGGPGGLGRAAVIVDDDSPLRVRHALGDPLQKDHLVDTGIAGAGNATTGEILRQEYIYQTYRTAGDQLLQFMCCYRCVHV